MRYVLLWIVGYLISNTMALAQKFVPDASIVRFDNALYQLISPQVTIETLATGFAFIEGPVWVEREKRLLFSDTQRNTIFSWTETEGVTVRIKPSGYTASANNAEALKEPGSNGLAFDAKGNLLLCQHGNRQLAKLTNPLGNQEDPSFEPLAETYQKQRLNSPNDLTVHSNGSIYFTDPPYGLQLVNGETLEQDLPFQGVYRLDRYGVLHLIDSSMSRPNGIALSHDEQTLLVSNSDEDDPYWKRYTLDELGLVVDEKRYYTVVDEGQHFEGAPDGLKYHSSGCLFATGPGGVWIFNSSGRVIGRIQVGEVVSNLTFDTKEKYLYLTASTSLVRIKMK